MRRGHVVAIGSAVVFVAVVGCSSGSRTAAPAPTAGPTLVVDGKAHPVQNKVECVTAANMVMANVGSDKDGIAVTVSAGDNPMLQDFTVVEVDGLPLTYSNSDSNPKPTVTKVGSSYKIVGIANSPAPAGSGSSSKPFDLEFTCPPRR